MSANEASTAEEIRCGLRVLSYIYMVIPVKRDFNLTVVN